AINEFPGQSGGFLGKRYDPFYINADIAKSGFRVPDIVLPPGMNAERLADRRALLPLLDRQLRAVESRGAFADRVAQYQRAYDLIGSPDVRRAFQLDREPERVRAAYGRHLFGQGCLLARRL